jgi:excinuclease ABC subunit C
MEKFRFIKKDELEKLPRTAGVYSFYKEKPFDAAQGKALLYIGKAIDLRERVKNHFLQPTFRDNLFVGQISRVGYIETGSEIEALILEANLIKKHQPRFNVVWRDDKNYFFVAMTKEEFPKVFITHQVKLSTNHKRLATGYVGPFVDGKPLKQTLTALQRIFPWRACSIGQKRPCLWYHLQRCSGPCTLHSPAAKQIPNLRLETAKKCQTNAKNVLRILKGGASPVLKDLKKEMASLSKSGRFEEAARTRDKIFSLERVLANARVLKNAQEAVVVLESDNWKNTSKILQKITGKKISRVEAYDISNIQGKEATGSMVTFINGLPNKNFYRKFKIRMASKPNDVAMLKEILTRRFMHPEWGQPDALLIDGGKAQLNAAINSLKASSYKLKPAIMSIAKQHNELFVENKKEPLLLDSLPRSIYNLILQLRDEAHRFAITYHKKLREKSLLR